MSDHCPKCGAAYFGGTDLVTYTCATEVDQNGVVVRIGVQCLRNQLAQANALLDEIEVAVQDVRFWSPVELKGILAKRKEAGDE